LHIILLFNYIPNNTSTIDHIAVASGQQNHKVHAALVMMLLKIVNLQH